MRHETHDRHRSIGGRPDCRRTDCRRPLRSGISILCPAFALSTELASAQPRGKSLRREFWRFSRSPGYRCRRMPPIRSAFRAWPSPTAFIVALFFIVAAPAIAFRPANRAVEFLARHAEHAALWLLGPALVAGMTVPNGKLQAVLTIAMAIELSWFLRHRWARRRWQLYHLNLADLSVLENQATGDLNAVSSAPRHP